jgi:hypothetical protein
MPTLADDPPRWVRIRGHFSLPHQPHQPLSVLLDSAHLLSRIGRAHHHRHPLHAAPGLRAGRVRDRASQVTDWMTEHGDPVVVLQLALTASSTITGRQPRTVLPPARSNRRLQQFASPPSSSEVQHLGRSAPPPRGSGPPSPGKSHTGNRDSWPRARAASRNVSPLRSRAALSIGGHPDREPVPRGVTFDLRCCRHCDGPASARGPGRS